MGEGGCVLTDRPQLKTLVESFRDWGRDCWCDPGKDNTCGKRFDWQLGDLPRGYDHKYIYSHIGYNLKVTDMQAAVGVAQLGKLDGFIAARRRNFARLRRRAWRTSQEFFLLPEATPGSRAELVRLPDRRAARGARSRGATLVQLPERAEDRHPPALRRQPAPPAGLRGHRAPRGRRPAPTPTSS